MPIDQVRKIADGRVHVAARALDLGLIDAVETFDEAIAELAQKVRPQKEATTRMEDADRRLRLARAGDVRRDA